MLIRTIPRSFLWGVLITTPGSGLVSAETQVGQTLNPIPLTRNGNESQVAVVKWAAFGSGCRSVDEMPEKDRTVLFTILPRNAQHVPKLVFDLTFPQYHLGSGKRVEKDGTLELYSECALRFAIRGQPGRRLKKVEGIATLDIQKEKGASLFIFNELRFGQFGSDEEKIEYDEQTEIKRTSLHLNLSKDLLAVRPDGKSSCGTDQVLFYDFTFFTKKSQKASQVNVTFQAPQRANLRLEYETCS